MTDERPAPERHEPARGWPGAIAATAVYLGLALWITWPLAPHLGEKVAADLGDPLFVTWALVWVMRHLTRGVLGDLAALDQLWDTNIFYPESNTLAFSDHFVTQAVQALPVWWLTHNPILAFNVSVLATMVLTGAGVFLLTRAYTGGFSAPLLAGVVAAFNPYRLSLELAHLQILSIQWLPFSLLALHRFIESGSHRWLAAGGVFLVALNLSSGYYLLYCAPLVLVFVLADLAIQGRLRQASRWTSLAVTAVCVALVTAPFVVPYVSAQRRFQFVRPLAEVIGYSATFEIYAVHLLPWAGVPLTLAIIALAAAMVERRPKARAGTILIAVLLVLAFWLSLGPVVQPFGVPGPYWLLWKYVPGFDGLRAVSRYGAIVLIFLPLLAGIGASRVRQVPRVGQALVIGLTALFLWNIWPAAFPLNGVIPSVATLRTPPPAYLDPSPRLPRIYQAVEGLDRQAVLAELPFGDPWYEVRYMYFAALHERRLMNGYSGFFPPSYLARQRALTDPLQKPAAALEALTGATHVLVHEDAWLDDTGATVIAWLESAGAEIIAADDGAALLALKPLRRNADRAALAP